MKPSGWFILVWLLILVSVVLYFIAPEKKDLSYYCLALAAVISWAPKA